MAKKDDKYGISRAVRNRDKEGKSDKAKARLQRKIDVRDKMKAAAGGEEAAGADIAANYDASAAGGAGFDKRDRRYLKSMGASNEDIRNARKNYRQDKREKARMAGDAMTGTSDQPDQQPPAPTPEPPAPTPEPTPQPPVATSEEPETRFAGEALKEDLYSEGEQPTTPTPTPTPAPTPEPPTPTPSPTPAAPLVDSSTTDSNNTFDYSTNDSNNTTTTTDESVNDSYNETDKSINDSYNTTDESIKGSYNDTDIDTNTGVQENELGENSAVANKDSIAMGGGNEYENEYNQDFNGTVDADSIVNYGNLNSDLSVNFNWAEMNNAYGDGASGYNPATAGMEAYANSMSAIALNNNAAARNTGQWNNIFMQGMGASGLLQPQQK